MSMENPSSRKPLRVYTCIYLGILYIPVLLVPLFSFNDSVYVKLPLSGFTTRWYQQLWNSNALLEALINSLQVAAVVSVISTFLGLTAAIALVRFRIHGWRSLSSFICLPLIVPHLVMGISLLMLITYVGVDLSLYTVGFGHVLVCTPFSMLVIMPRLEGFDQSLEEASRDLGEGPLSTFRLITLPLIMPAVVSSLLLTATISLDEFLIAFFLSGTDATLPVFIWGQLRFPDQLPAVLALGALIILISIGLVVLAEVVRRRGLDTLKHDGHEN